MAAVDSLVVRLLNGFDSGIFSLRGCLSEVDSYMGGCLRRKGDPYDGITHKNEDTGRPAKVNVSQLLCRRLLDPAISSSVSNVCLTAHLIQLWMYNARSCETTGKDCTPFVRVNVTSAHQEQQKQQLAGRFETIARTLLGCLAERVERKTTGVLSRTQGHGEVLAVVVLGDTLCQALSTLLALRQEDPSCSTALDHKFLSKSVGLCCSAITLTMEAESGDLKIEPLLEAFVSLMSSPLFPGDTVRSTIPTVIATFVPLALTMETDTLRQMCRSFLCHLTLMGKHQGGQNQVSVWDTVMQQALQEAEDTLYLMETKKPKEHAPASRRLHNALELLAGVLTYFAGSNITEGLGHVNYVTQHYLRWIRAGIDHCCHDDVKPIVDPATVHATRDLTTAANKVLMSVITITPAVQLLMRSSVFRQLLHLYTVDTDVVSLSNLGFQLQLTETVCSLVSLIRGKLPGLLRGSTIMAVQTTLLQLLMGTSIPVENYGTVSLTCSGEAPATTHLLRASLTLMHSGRFDIDDAAATAVGRTNTLRSSTTSAWKEALTNVLKTLTMVVGMMKHSEERSRVDESCIRLLWLISHNAGPGTSSVAADIIMSDAVVEAASTLLETSFFESQGRFSACHLQAAITAVEAAARLPFLSMNTKRMLCHLLRLLKTRLAAARPDVTATTTAKECEAAPRNTVGTADVCLDNTAACDRSQPLAHVNNASGLPMTCLNSAYTSHSLPHGAPSAPREDGNDDADTTMGEHSSPGNHDTPMEESERFGIDGDPRTSSHTAVDGDTIQLSDHTTRMEPCSSGHEKTTKERDACWVSNGGSVHENVIRVNEAASPKDEGCYSTLGHACGESCGRNDQQLNTVPTSTETAVVIAHSVSTIPLLENERVESRSREETVVPEATEATSVNRDEETAEHLAVSPLPPDVSLQECPASDSFATTTATTPPSGECGTLEANSIEHGKDMATDVRVSLQETLAESQSRTADRQDLPSTSVEIEEREATSLAAAPSCLSAHERRNEEHLITSGVSPPTDTAKTPVAVGSSPLETSSSDEDEDDVSPSFSLLQKYSDDEFLPPISEQLHDSSSHSFEELQEAAATSPPILSGVDPKGQLEDAQALNELTRQIKATLMSEALDDDAFLDSAGLKEP